MLRFLSLIPLVAGLLVACDGQTVESSHDAGSIGHGNEAGSIEVAPDAGGTADAGSAADAGSGPDGGSALQTGARCAALASEASSTLGSAYESATANLSCQSDSDCTLGPSGSNCTFGCGGPVTTSAGAAALQAAIDRVNSTVCAAYVEEGCPAPTPPPCALGPFGAACVNGACTNLLPAAWTSFSFDQASGAVGFSTPPFCEAGDNCSLWTVTPDGRVAVTDAQGMHQANLSSADFATVDGILRSVSFRRDMMMNSFGCDASPGGQVISYNETRDGSGSEGVDVTGCVLGGPPGNGPQELFDVVEAY